MTPPSRPIPPVPRGRRLPALDPRPEDEPVEAVVALGSNLGDTAATIDDAVRAIRRLPLVDGHAEAWRAESAPSLHS